MTNTRVEQGFKHPWAWIGFDSVERLARNVSGKPVGRLTHKVRAAACNGPVGFDRPDQVPGRVKCLHDIRSPIKCETQTGVSAAADLYCFRRERNIDPMSAGNSACKDSEPSRKPKNLP